MFAKHVCIENSVLSTYAFIERGLTKTLNELRVCPYETFYSWASAASLEGNAEALQKRLEQ